MPNNAYHYQSKLLIPGKAGRISGLQIGCSALSYLGFARLSGNAIRLFRTNPDREHAMLDKRRYRTSHQYDLA
jgi:hypothetical protein